MLPTYREVEPITVNTFVPIYMHIYLFLQVYLLNIKIVASGKKYSQSILTISRLFLLSTCDKK